MNPFLSIWYCHIEDRPFSFQNKMRFIVLIINFVLAGSAVAVEEIDAYMRQFLAENNVPGAAVAVSRDGRMLYSKGYGWADKEAKEPVKPTSLFRIASISKPITSVAIMQLVESGKISLDDRLAKHLQGMADYRRHSGFDERIEKITIRDLLRHSGGWDRSEDFDPMGLKGHLLIAKELDLEPPVDVRDYITFMFQRPLQFDPGSRFAYSNFGYLLLGRIIEDVTGLKYETYLKKHVLAPIGITSMQIGHLSKEDRAPNEVTYYDYQNRTATAPFGPQRGKEVSYPYARPIQVMDAHGGWIASTRDLVLFSNSLDKLLKPNSIETLFARQPGILGNDKEGKPKASFYALGWSVRPKAKGANHWHSGLIQGTSTLLVSRHDGYSWALLFNTSSNADGKTLSGLIDGPFHGLVDSVSKWPDE
jgi:N-acyl-D-amino-acid deacylase